MSPEAQRITIAKACGYKYGNVFGGYGFIKYGKQVSAPDYLNDLNAMHEAEKVLDESKQRIFLDMLDELVPHGNGISVEGYVAHTNAMFQFVHATAAQRAEAFLRTLNLWKDE
jgi:hypothetical protein